MKSQKWNQIGIGILAAVIWVTSVEADQWPDAVADFQLGTAFVDPLEHGLGAPDYPSPTWGASPGEGGYVTYQFTDNIITNGPGNDFEVYLGPIDSVHETANVYVSYNGNDFFSVGTLTDGTSDQPTGFDIGSTGLTQARYVKIVDVPGDGDAVDIDAIGAIDHSSPPPPPPPPPQPAGVTILVHGYELTGGIGDPLVDDWGTNNVQALVTRLGGGVVYRYNPNDGSYSEVLGTNNQPMFTPRDANGERILVFNWRAASNDPVAGQAEAAADALFASLVQAGYVSPTNPGASKHLHFIGHSRGCVVVSETVQRLCRYNVTVDYITYLDPHDYGQPGIAPDDFFHDPAVQVWENVLYADNYWQQLSPISYCLANPGGRSITNIPLWPAGENRNISELLVNSVCPPVPHTRVKDYYFGTITPSTEEPAWYPDGSGESSGFSKWLAGGGYNRQADSSLLRVACDSGGSVFPYYWNNDISNDSGVLDQNDSIPPKLFMGDFKLSHLAQYVPAGWSYHGGGGSAYLEVSGGNAYLRLMPNAYSKQHNRLYFRSSTSAVTFELFVIKPNSKDRLWLYIGTQRAGSITLSKKSTTWGTYSIPISSFANKVDTFKFQLENIKGKLLKAQVAIDNIRFNP